MLDQYNRNINYLRISVTDRCNLRCFYCMPDEGVKLIPHKNILSFEEITEFVKVAVSYGINKIRLTGGEPLVRKDIVKLVAMIAEIEGIKDFGMSTNGIYLWQYAEELKKAGLQRVNISLDTVNPEKFREITRYGNIEDVFKSINKAKEVGLTPVKINCVVKNSKNEKDAIEVSDFCQKNGLMLRFIKLMSLRHGIFSVVENGEGGNCKICNRLRLTADGKLRPCLFDNIEYDIRQLGATEALRLAVENKPACGNRNTTNYFSNIGG